MNGIRKVLAIVAAFGLAALSLPGYAAPTKQFGITMSPAVVPASGCTAQNPCLLNLSVKVTNLTPSGNSTINTFILTPPSGFITGGSFISSPSIGSAVSGAAPTGGTRVQCPASWVDFNNVTHTAATDPGAICIANMPSVLKAGCTPACTWNMNITVSLATSPAACMNAQWTPYSFNGNSFNGDTFQYVKAAMPGWSGSVDTTQVAGGANTATFSTAPQNTTVGTVIPPPSVVSLATSCGPAPDGTAVTIAAVNTLVNPDFTCTVGSGCLSGNVANTSGGAATFSSLKINTPGTYHLTATATGYPDAVAPVDITVFSGTLACGGTLDQSFTNPNNLQDFQPGYVTGSRGNYNKGNKTCILIPYLFTNSILSPDPITGNDNTVHLNWDPSVDPHAVFTYTVNWKARTVDASGITQGWHTCPNAPNNDSVCRPSVAWLNTDGSPASLPGIPAFIPGLACLGTNPPDNMPAPYGKLTAAIDNLPATNSFNIDTTGALVALPPVGSPLVVDNERMDITGIALVSGAVYKLTVNRAVHFSSITGHAQNALAMSTPMPIIPNQSPYSNGGQFAGYQPGHIAEMCVNENGFAAYGNGQVYDFSTFIDQDGDGWGTHP